SDEVAFGSEPCVPSNQKSGTRNSFDHRFKVGMRRHLVQNPASHLIKKAALEIASITALKSG
ncbi:UNVERIFIED_CONTAM: hypothetical protein NY100_02160, partial [Prevotella sp. 15_C9]